MATHPDRDKKLAQLLAAVPVAEEAFASWPGEVGEIQDLQTRASVAVGGVNDPRLVVMRAVSRTGTGVRIGWCLLGPASNFERPSTPLPRTPLPAFTTSAASRVLSLLAVDAESAEATAQGMLADAATARQVTAVADAVAVQDLAAGQPLSIGVQVLGIDPGPRVFHGSEVDLVCVGAPAWIGQ